MPLGGRSLPEEDGWEEGERVVEESPQRIWGGNENLEGDVREERPC